MTRAVAITPGKEVLWFDVTGLDDLQTAVGGLIELVALERNGQDATMWVNEEGLYLPLDFNSMATDLCGGCGRHDILLYGGLRGTAVLQGPGDGAGGTTGLTDDHPVYRFLLRVASKAGGTIVGAP